MILFAVVIIILCAFPFVIMSRNKSSKEKDFKDSLQNLAANNQSKIDAFDRWNVLRRQSDGWSNVCCRVVDCDGGCVSRLLFAGATGDTSRSIKGAKVRVNQQQEAG